MDAYKGDAYQEINAFLRQNNEEEINKQSNSILVRYIKDIDSNMSNNGELNNLILYRGIGNGVIPAVISGSSGVLVNKAYTSCSFKLNVAKGFLDEDDECCILVFTIPANIKYYIYKDDNDEKEVLIQRNTQFTINLSNSQPPIYNANLSLWEPPAIKENIPKSLIQGLAGVLSNRCQEIGTDEFRKERTQKYIDEGEDEEDAEFLADIDVNDNC